MMTEQSDEQIAAIRSRWDALGCDGRYSNEYVGGWSRAVFPALLAAYDTRAVELARLRAFLWASARELNAINAREGAERHGVTQEWWDKILEGARVELGGDIKPWPDEDMKPHFAALEPPQ